MTLYFNFDYNIYRLKSESDRWEEILQEQTDHAEQAQQWVFLKCLALIV